MRVFVTGATGFVGGYAARRLVEGGHEVVCLVRDPGRAAGLEALGARLVAGDVADRTAVRAGMRGCGWVVHLANVYTLWERDPTLYWRVNVEGTRNVMEVALAEAVAKVVHVSTVAVWGRPAELPFDEATPVGPRRFSAYAESKYQGDLIAWRLQRERGLPLVVVHPSNVLGAGNSRATGSYVRDFVRRRLPAQVFPDRVMSYVYVRDVAEAIARAAEVEGNVGQQYIVSSARISFRDYNALLAELSGVPPPALTVPDWLVRAGARLATLAADLTGRPPLWGMADDAARTVEHGLEADGSKAARELGIAYTPIRVAVAEEVAQALGQPPPGRPD